MLITFKSGVAADVMMFGDVAKKLMEVMGKAPADKGIVTVEQMPEAIARLKRMVAEDKARRAAEKTPEQEEEPPAAPRITLGQRALPLIELLERSLKEEEAVVWGV